jgi:hypothetical protein
MSAAARICEAAKMRTSPILTKGIVTEKRRRRRDGEPIAAATEAVRIVTRFAKVLAILAYKRRAVR